MAIAGYGDAVRSSGVNRMPAIQMPLLVNETWVLMGEVVVAIAVSLVERLMSSPSHRGGPREMGESCPGTELAP